MSAWKSAAITPSAARLTESLRDIGYDFPSAVADIVDNSVMAGASHVDVTIEFAGEDSYVVISDDGDGMTSNGLVEALRYGSRRTYGRSDLGRYGLGLKTASLSQCRSVTVVTGVRAVPGVVHRRMLDLDLIAEWDEWLVVEPPMVPVIERSADRLTERAGNGCDLAKAGPGAAGEAPGRRMGPPSAGQPGSQDCRASWHRVPPVSRGDRWPGTRDHRERAEGAALESFRAQRTDDARNYRCSASSCPSGMSSGTVTLRRFVLPARDQFSSPEEFERYSGPLNWNRQQGIYIYRADRLVQWGGWNGIRGIDEHTKLARASLEFDTDLDSVFNINVAKMRVTLPPQIRQMLERPINELCGLCG